MIVTSKGLNFKVYFVIEFCQLLKKSYCSLQNAHYRIALLSPHINNRNIHRRSYSPTNIPRLTVAIESVKLPMRYSIK